MIQAENISKRFGSIEAVRDVSFTVEKGEIVGLLGPNGAGKTTTMRILACFMPATSGTVKINGIDAGRHSLQARRKIGYALEKASLYPDMRVQPFLSFVGEVKGISGSSLKKAVLETLSLCGLENVKHRIIKNLSKGYQQRMMLAQALINKPDVLILDEPTIGLDPENVSEIRTLIKSLSGERTILLSSHILSEVAMICGKVMIMNHGRIIAKDTPENLGLLLQDRQLLDVRIQGPSDRVCEALEKIEGVLRAEIKDQTSRDISQVRIEFNGEHDIYPALNAVVFENRWTLREMKAIHMTLEDIFFKMVSASRETEP